MNELIIPLYYFQRRKISDRKWIESRMSVIPSELKQEVVDEYEKIFRTSKAGRRAANESLQQKAKENRKPI